MFNKGENLEVAVQQMQYPLFVKPAKAGDSFGVDEKSLVNNIEELQQKIHLKHRLL